MPLPPYLSRWSMSPESRYSQVEACMGRYVSPITVSSVLRKAMSTRSWHGGAPPSGDALDDIVAEAMIGLRLFVHPSRLPVLMVELAEILEADER